MRTPTESLHMKLFPEEYDLVHDSIYEWKQRKKGNLPMADAYLSHINSRRRKYGIKAFDGGLESYKSSMEFSSRVVQCLDEEGLTTLLGSPKPWEEKIFRTLLSQMDPHNS